MEQTDSNQQDKEWVSLPSSAFDLSHLDNNTNGEDQHTLIFLEPDRGQHQVLWCEDQVEKDWTPYVRADKVLDIYLGGPDLDLIDALYELLNERH